MANLKLKITRGNSTDWLRCFSMDDALGMIERINRQHEQKVIRALAEDADQWQRSTLSLIESHFPDKPVVKVLNVGQKV